MLLAMLVGFGYYTLFKTNISDISVTYENGNREAINLPFQKHSKKANETFIFEYVISSRIAQNKRIHMTADDEIMAVHVNDDPIALDSIKKRYKQDKLKDYKRGYNFDLPLQSGNNVVKVFTKNYNSGSYTFKIGVHLYYVDYLIFFLLLVLPFVIVMIDCIHRYVNGLKNRALALWNKAHTLSTMPLNSLPMVIIVTGILLRVLYIVVYGHSSYQHDQYYHIEFIKYFAEHWSLPLPDKALEFPQQPLYYFIMGKLFALLNFAGVGEKNILMTIAGFSTFFMSAVLLIAYQTLKQLTDKAFTINTALAFLAFTPSFVFLAGQINNDPLNYFLAVLAMYYGVRYWYSNKSYHFFLALLFAVLVFLTKVSSGLISIFLFGILLYKYFLSSQNSDKERITVHMKIFAVVILFFLGLSFLRVYLPSTHEFFFVDSGVFSGQAIKRADVSYFFSFHIIDLISEGQAYVYDKVFEALKQSYFTWQYATMLLGEYNYKRVMDNLMINKMVYATSMIYVTGFLAFIYYFKSMPFIVKMFAFMIAVNQILIMNFVMNYPSACNADFRYNSPTIMMWGSVAAFGLNALSEHVKKWQRSLHIAVVMASLVQIVWLVKILLIAKTNTIT